MADQMADDDLTPDQKLGLALVSLLTPVAGGLMGGRQGAMAGAQAGFTAAGGAAGEIAKEQSADRKATKAAEAAAAKYERARKDRMTDAKAMVDYREGKKPQETPLQQTQFLGKNGQPLVFDKKSGTYREAAAPEGVQKPAPALNAQQTPYTDAEGKPLVFDPRGGAYKPAVAPEGTKKPGGADLPLDAKKQVETLSTKNASKIAIKNQMASYYEQFKAAKTKDDQIRIGRQMLKVLNSPEGADAISVEEANRLGNALEVQVFNWKGPGPLFGRDLEGFGSQVEATIGAIDGSIQANQAQIDTLMGRKPAAAPSAPAPTGPKAGDVVDGYVFMGGDPGDEKNWTPKE